MPLPPIVDLAVFMGLMLTFALFGLTASGHFPAEHRPAVLRTGPGMLLLWGSIGCAVVMLGVALVIAVERLPLYASIIGGGAMLLVAPLILQRFPDTFVDGRPGLVSLAALGLVLVAIALSGVA